MALRFVRLLRSIGVDGVVLITGGLANDKGLRAALQDALDQEKGLGGRIEAKSHPDSLYAGAIGAAIWGGFRRNKLQLKEPAWTANTTIGSS
jgi:benzoyl-CoA reductase subunit D